MRRLCSTCLHPRSRTNLLVHLQHIFLENIIITRFFSVGAWLKTDLENVVIIATHVGDLLIDDSCHPKCAPQFLPAAPHIPYLVIRSRLSVVNMLAQKLLQRQEIHWRHSSLVACSTLLLQSHILTRIVRRIRCSRWPPVMLMSVIAVGENDWVWNIL